MNNVKKNDPLLVSIGCAIISIFAALFYHEIQIRRIASMVESHECFQQDTSNVIMTVSDSSKGTLRIKSNNGYLIINRWSK